jgi:hypothetical protein
MFLRPPSQEDTPLTFPEVFQKEQDLLVEARVRREVPPKPSSDRALDRDLVGLAFSGGGIRSATFNLGVIQALAGKNLLRFFDYLSTVSGGGYIGSWLTSWAYRLSRDPGPVLNHIARVEAELNRGPQHVGDISEPHEVHFLRKYSNYLTPRLGAFSGDTLAFVATYLRNLILNQMILASALFAFLLLPSALALILAQYHDNTSAWVSAVLAVLFLLLAIVGVTLNTHSHPYKTINVVRFVAVPLFCFSLLTSYVLWHLACTDVARHWIPNLGWIKISALIAAGGVIYSLLWFVGLVVEEWKLVGERHDDPGNYILAAPVLWAFPVGAASVGLLLLIITWMADYLVGADPNAQVPEIQYLLALWVPLVTVLMLFVGVLHLGLVGRAYEDGLREWWARLGGIVLAITISWLAVCILVFCFPLWMHNLYCYLTGSGGKAIWKFLSGLGVTGAITGWIGTTLKGLFAAKSEQTGPRPGANKTQDFLAQLAPPVFAVGLLMLFSVALYWLLPLVFREDAARFWTNCSLWGYVLGACIVLGVFSFFLGSRVDVNEFSLHNAYRNRLVRCYLGATHRPRHPQAFTGFDENDNIYFHDVQNLATPFHIVNATLNVVKGKELALQSRKARSFTFTPLYSGFDYTEEESSRQLPGAAAPQQERTTSDPRVHKSPSYRPTRFCSWRSRYPGARLGTAMAISGAAVSPSMGHYTTGAVSFLLTIFSVRLGWWMGNTRWPKTWESGKPRSSWDALMRELTGSTNEDEAEVYLSDGGHFENLAIYELVRRRCRVIVACDAGADSSYAFGDLAGAIEKCRVDFSTVIDIDLREIVPSSDLFPDDSRSRASQAPFTVGQITYPDGTSGTLIYIKPCLSANLPQDVLAYARLCDEFPHQSTVDQFFDETQFESYRVLGHACASAALDTITDTLRA